ncbi:hypothetical protein, partial [Allorhodopirellula heiligendammensis]|uniref:hypothetical protein n=1 Tax=Allorhodopirellula heiligendammensis TaxID=2714739 RepID=UPI00265F09C8
MVHDRSNVARPGQVNSTDYEVQGLTSGVGLFFVLLHFFSAGGGEVPFAGGFFRSLARAWR